MEKIYKGESIEQVIELLAKFKEESKLLAGGTDIIIALRNEKISPKVLIDISGIKELKKIEDYEDRVVIGAGVSFTQVLESELFTDNLFGLNKACREVGSPQIRNKGTIGGNIGNNSPAADSVPPLISLEGKLKILSTRGLREVLIEDFVANKEDSIMDDEIIISIEFNKVKENQRLSFSKLGLRKALAISRITISTLIGQSENGNIDFVRVASGSIGRYPMRELEVEEYLLGKELNDDTIKEAVKVLQLSMDKRLKGRATHPYKRRAVETILMESLNDSLISFSEVLA